MKKAAIKNKGSIRKQYFVVAFLWLLVVGSALAVVSTTYLSRKNLNELEVLRKEFVGLQVVWGQYLLEQSSWAAYSRVEKIASNDLQMKVPQTKDIVVISSP